MRKSYGQYCGLARALDRIGDRWTLLIVRELLVGPQRFADLRAALPGIATNLLSARLRHLTADGLVTRRRLEPPAAVFVYEATELGRGLEPAVLALTRWGGNWMGERGGDEFSARWLVIALRAVLDAERAAEADVTAELRVDGAILHVRARDGRLDVGVGAASDADIVLEADGPTLLGIAAGRLPLRRAAVRGSRSARAAIQALFAAREDGQPRTASRIRTAHR